MQKTGRTVTYTGSHSQEMGLCRKRTIAYGANGVWLKRELQWATLVYPVTLMNLIRIRNKKVLERYNCTQLYERLLLLSNIPTPCTGALPHPKQVVYKERVLEVSFDFGGIAGPGRIGKDIAEFFSEKPPVRIQHTCFPCHDCDTPQSALWNLPTI